MAKRKAKQFNHFILNHRKIFILLLVILSAVGVAVISDNIKAEEEPINLVLLNAAEENSVDNPYILDSVDDFITLQEYSKTHTCEGMYFRAGEIVTSTTYYYSEDEDDEDDEGSESGIAYNLSLAGYIFLEDESRVVFNGIGQNFAFPFKGDIDFKGITLRMDTSLFCFLGDGANIHQLTMVGNIDTTKVTQVMGANVSVGALASIVYLNTEDSETNITNISVTHSVITGGNKSTGGIVGTVIGNKNNVTLNVNTVSVEADVKGTGATGVNYGTALATGKILMNFPGYSGGIIGEVASYNQAYYINVNMLGNCKYAGNISNTNMGSGGLIGHTCHRVKVKLDGNFNLLDLTSLTAASNAYTYKGYLIGSAAYSMAYMTPSSVVQKPTDVNMISTSEIEKDNTANGVYATQIFKNTEDSFFETEVLIEGKGTETEPYLLSSAEDFERMAVLFTTHGFFGTWKEGTVYQSWFDVSEATNRTSEDNIMQYVRSAYFCITNDVDLSEKGIIRLNRDAAYAFMGCIEGKQGTYANGEYPTIRNEVDTYQDVVALFTFATGYLKDGVSQERTFKNFNLYGNIVARGGISGLILVLTESNTAYSSYTFENIQMNLNIDARVSTSNVVAGLIGDAQLQGVTTNATTVAMNFEDITFRGKLSANSSGANGGALAAKIQTTCNTSGNPTAINIENFLFEGDIVNTGSGACYVSTMLGQIIANTAAANANYISGELTNYYINSNLNVNNVTIRNSKVDHSVNGNNVVAGVLGYNWQRVDGKITDITLDNIEYNFGSAYGAFLLTSTGLSVLDFDGITYKDISIIKPSSTANSWISTMLYDNYAIVKVRNFASENCVMKLYKSYPYVSETAANHVGDITGTKVNYYGTLSFEGLDEKGEKYTAVNTYENKFQYTDLAGTATYSIYGGARLSYSLEDNMGDSLISGTGTKTDPFIIDTEAKLEIMSTINNTHHSLKSYWLKYFKDIESILTEEQKNGKPALPATVMSHRMGEGYYVFAKSLDLTEYSYYPAVVYNEKYYGFDAYQYYADKGITDPSAEQIKSACVDAVEVLSGGTSTISIETANSYKPNIHFAADKVAGEAMGTGTTGKNVWNSPTYVYGNTHRNMHASLFCGITGGTYNGYKKGIVDINNIMLDGVFSSYCYGATGGGALISRTNSYEAVQTTATVNIQNIDFGNTIIVPRGVTATTSNYGMGLLVESMSSSKLNISNIKVLDGSKVRCDALIGYQYGTSSRTVFRHIDLNAAIENETPVNEKETAYHSDGYGFRYGYFFYHLKEGMAIYWYDEGTDVVTPGLYDDETGARTIPNPDVLEYQKYAYKIINVDINPLTANITKGKGTEDEPYIIENLGQLTTLALAVRSKGESTTYQDWYVGNSEDNTYVSEDGDVTGYWDDDYESWADNSNLLYRTKDNPLQALEHLMTAYYKIDADLDFAHPPKGFEQAATDFFGIGTVDYPFSGVIDGNGHSISYGDSSSTYANMFGLLAYAQGFKVSDLTLKSGANPITVNNTGEVYVGMLAAYVLGGDNVIDNVKIESSIKLKSNSIASTVMVGGYVGYLKYGTLTISGMTEDTFKDFQIGYSDAMSMPTYSDTNAKYISAIAGRVDGAAIIYRNENDHLPDSQFWIDASRVVTTEGADTVCRVADLNYYNRYGVGASRERGIYNQSYFDTIGKIKVVKDTDGGAFICEIENEGQLLLYSIALASGSLSSYNAYSATVAYNVRAACQKMDEDFTDWVDYEGETELSNLYDCPYVFRYFDFTELSGGYLDTIYSGCGRLNNAISTVRTSKTHRTTIKLTKDTDVYDMTVFGDAFRGIGDATSLATNTRPTCGFVANFDGNNKTIQLDMNATWDAGLFNTLATGGTDNSAAPCIIKDLVISGKIETNGGQLGGVVGYYLNGYYSFQGITIKDMTLINNSASGYAGGILGYSYNNTGGYLSYQNCMIGDKTAEDNKSVYIYSANSPAGGVIGYASAFNFQGCEISHITIETEKSTIGGFIGTTSASYANNMTAENLISSNCTFITHSATATGIGGIVGNLSSPATSSSYVALHNVTVKDNEFIADGALVNKGKIIGQHSGTTEISVLCIEDVDSEEFIGETAFDMWQCLSASGRCFYIYYNDFCDLEKAEQRFGIDRAAVDESDRLIARYSECLENDVFTVGTGTIDPETGEEIMTSVDLIPGTAAMDNTMVKWSSDTGTIESVLNSVLSSLTNGTGKLNADINNNITVNVKQMQVSHGVVTEVAGGTPSVSIEKKAGDFIVNNNNKYDTIEKYDAQGNYVPGTYSLIEVTYSIGSGKYKETIQIPFFVSKMINVDIYSKLTIGEEYDIDVMRAISRTSSDVLKTTKDSSYMVYTEYMYSSNRFDFEEDIYMYKGFKLYESPEPNIPIGTKLTLLDVTDDKNPKVYYYEVKIVTDFIPLSDFADEDGNYYKERNLRSINALPEYPSYKTMYVNGRQVMKYNRGVEKYYIFVDCSYVAQIGAESQMSPIVMNGVASGQDEYIENKEVFYVKYRSYNTISTYNGRTIKFVEDSVTTTGEINKNKQLNVIASFSDRASDTYWSTLRDFDYVNRDKYLEVAIYLENEDGDKVMLPSGTKLKFGSDENSVYETAPNLSSVYYYKDGANTSGFKLKDITRNTITDINLSFDFTYAKMEYIPEGKYKICLELVRTANKDFPMGDDSLGIIRSDYIQVTPAAEYGFRLNTDGIDSLAFNMSDSGILDENGNLNVEFAINASSSLSSTLAATKQAVVTLQLYKKDEILGTYKPLETDLTEYPILELEQNGTVQNLTLNGSSVSYDIDALTGEGEPYVNIPVKLTMPGEMDAVNYKLTAIMYVNGEKVATDYFICNIANIN